MSTAPVRTPAAPWVRTRLRAMPLAALLTAVLVFGTALLAAALPRTQDRTGDQALRALLLRNGPTAWALAATAPMGTNILGSQAPAPDDPMGPAKNLDHLHDLLVGGLPAPLRPAATGTVYGVRGTEPRPLRNPELPRPDGVAPKADLDYLHDAAAHARLVAGRWPADDTKGLDYDKDLEFEVALAQPVAAKLGIGVGAVLDGGQFIGYFSPGKPRPPIPIRATVVGVFTPDDPASPYWTAVQCLTAPCLTGHTAKSGQADMYWRFGALLDPAESSMVGTWGMGEDFFRIPFDLSALHGYQLPQIKRAIASLLSGPTRERLTASIERGRLSIESMLPGLLVQAQARQAAVAPLTVLGPVGAAGVATAVLCLAAALAADRRSAELRLLRARGGSRTGILRRLLGEGAVTVLPAAVAGTVLALLLLPTARWGGALLAAALVTLVGWLAFPLRALALPAAPRPGGSRRRLVAELAVLVLTVGAVLAVNRRGVAPAGQGVDLLLVSAPLLLALTGALLLARLHPVLIGGLARRTARRPGPIAFLGLAGAARGTGGRARPSILPLLALLLAVTTAGFGATVLDSVAAARAAAARIEVGGDVSVTADQAGLPDGFAAAAARLPGVRSASTVTEEDDVPFSPGDGTLLPGVSVVIVDPAAYAQLARRVGRGGFDPAALADDGKSDTPVPALVSRDIAGHVDSQPHDLTLPPGALSVRMAGVIDGTPALRGTESKIIVLPAGPVTRRFPGIDHATQWLATGSVDPAALRPLLGPGGADDRIRTSVELVRELAADPLQSGAARLFWAAILAAAGYAVLSVLLTLVRAAPERAARLARLRTMGLRPREGLALILTEALPQVLTASVAGALLAAAAVPLLGPAVDIAAMVGAGPRTGLHPAALPVLLQAGLLAAVGCLTVLAETAVSGRRQITTELRAGDER